jgi:hypothetical protein
MDEWISVKDRLPGTKINKFLLYFKEFDYVKEWDEKPFHTKPFVLKINNEYRDAYVTHWMPRLIERYTKNLRLEKPA